MVRKVGESHREFKARMIDPVSESFCGAKWLNATIWLGHGGTTSCHHPPAHQIDLEEIKTNPSAIHNTRHKKKMRQMMQEGTRPKECEYCWKIEDMGKDADGNEPVSDRTYKTVIYEDSDLDKIATLDPQFDVNLKTLEIAFDRTCQLACSYCNPAFSSTWVKDIRTNGGYQGIKSDARGHFIDDAPYAEPFDQGEDNPYVDAFWRWWPELSSELEEIRVTGGEPLMTPSIYKLFDWFKETDDPNKHKMRLAINSNLMAKEVLLNKFIDATQHIDHFHVYTSCEAYGRQAEYIRDGLEWEIWTSQFERFATEARYEGVHMMMTINALCLFSITEFMDEMIKLKERYGQFAPAMSFNILRFPSFQSAVTLPQDIKKRLADNLEYWLHKVGKPHELFFDMEEQGVERLISYLREVQVGHQFTSSIESRERDFKSFHAQYDVRRNKSFAKTFPKDIVDWYESIPMTDLKQLQGIVDGDSTKGNMMKKELEKRAKDEGWVLDPQGPNPGSQEYKEELNET